MASKQIQDFSAEELSSMSASQIIDALGGMGELEIINDGFVKPHFKKAIEEMPKVPLMVPTPDSWNAPFPYKQHFKINGMKFAVEGDVLTMVPLTVFEVWRNKVEGEQLLRAHKRAARKAMNASLSEIPHY